MVIEVLKSKLHRATVTGADLAYEGSISIDPTLIRAAGMFLYEKVEVYNITNGNRFATYILEGKKKEICLNGAAARLVVPGDRIIIASYTYIDSVEAERWKPTVLLLDENNEILAPGE